MSSECQSHGVFSAAVSAAGEKPSSQCPGSRIGMMVFDDWKQAADRFSCVFLHCVLTATATCREISFPLPFPREIERRSRLQHPVSTSLLLSPTPSHPPAPPNASPPHSHLFAAGHETSVMGGGCRYTSSADLLSRQHKPKEDPKLLHTGHDDHKQSCCCAVAPHTHQINDTHHLLGSAWRALLRTTIYRTGEKRQVVE